MVSIGTLPLFPTQAIPTAGGIATRTTPGLGDRISGVIACQAITSIGRITAGAASLFRQCEASAIAGLAVIAARRVTTWARTFLDQRLDRQVASNG